MSFDHDFYSVLSEGLSRQRGLSESPSGITILSCKGLLVVHEVPRDGAAAGGPSCRGGAAAPGGSSSSPAGGGAAADGSRSSGGGGAAASGESSSSGGGWGARPPPAGGPPAAENIDADFLLETCEDCTCILCFGVLAEPTTGCDGGHLCCRKCYVEWLREKRECPTCRQKVQSERKLVRIRSMDGMISRLQMRCIHSAKEAAGAGPPAAKRAKLAPAASMTVEALRNELRQGGLDTSGNKEVLVERLEKDRKKDAGCNKDCRWIGKVGGLTVHLEEECDWVAIKCLGCTESPLRKDLPEHDA